MQDICTFLQLLSLGFATIGVRATLVAVGGQAIATVFGYGGLPKPEMAR
jgi:hypothetical protein